MIFTSVFGKTLTKFSCYFESSLDCKQHNFCNFCSDVFCGSCKLGFDFQSSGDWCCIDCARQRDLVDMFQRKENEERGNFCANCFLCQDDMDGVTLKQCSSCKMVKYCRYVNVAESLFKLKSIELG